jgi:hypothetical protein
VSPAHAKNSKLNWKQNILPSIAKYAKQCDQSVKFHRPENSQDFFILSFPDSGLTL